MRLPMKPWQTPATTATFLIFLASCIAVTSTSGAVFAPRTTSSNFITLAGEKKCRPSTSCGREVERRDLVDVEIGGVGGEDRARLGDLVELAENLLLDVHILEHGLDDQVAIGEVLEAERRLQQAHRAFDLLGGHPALGRARLVILAHHAGAAVERVLRHLDDRHRDAGARGSSSRCRRPSCRRRSRRRA